MGIGKDLSGSGCTESPCDRSAVSVVVDAGSPSSRGRGGDGAVKLSCQFCSGASGSSDFRHASVSDISSSAAGGSRAVRSGWVVSVEGISQGAALSD